MDISYKIMKIENDGFVILNIYVDNHLMLESFKIMKSPIENLERDIYIETLRNIKTKQIDDELTASIGLLKTIDQSKMQGV